MSPAFRFSFIGACLLRSQFCWGLAVAVLWLLGANAAPCVADERPKLVVVVSIDQLPFEYLERFRDGLSPKGMFLRLMNDGANFVACNHGHAFTVTAPGHSVMLTGTFPCRNGIIDNQWYDRATGRNVYCVSDDAYPLVGANPDQQEKGISPKNLLAPTLGDSLKLARPESKVFGISCKDRTAVLMTGHAADGAYWFDNVNGNWITSTYYREQLPQYIRVLNEGDAAEAFLGKSWTLLHPAERYRVYHPPGQPGKTGKAVKGFPHEMGSKADEKYYKNVALSPYGNDFTLGGARMIMTAEKLGKDDAPDLLAINLSSIDFVGHTYGPHSLEVQDMFYRTDLQLAAFVADVDEHMAGAPWVFALTSDHGVAPIPEYAERLRLPSARNPLGSMTAFRAKLEQKMRDVLGEPAGKRNYVQFVDDNCVYLHHNLPELAGEKLLEGQRIVREAMLAEPSVAVAFMREELIKEEAPGGLALQFQRAFNAERSGDVLYALRPYNIPASAVATHGTPWKYDTHVPLFFWGSGVRAGTYTQPVTPAHLAPTLARLLRVEAPAMCSVEPLEEAIAPRP